jgi:hypothetical protein
MLNTIFLVYFMVIRVIEIWPPPTLPPPVATLLLSSHPTTEKLARANHTTWRAQVLITLRGAPFEGFVTGKKEASVAEVQEKVGDTTTMIVNPEYKDWLAAD